MLLPNQPYYEAPIIRVKRGKIIMTDELEECGIISLSSRYSVAESVERIKAALLAKGMTIFAVIDQSREAEKVVSLCDPQN